MANFRNSFILDVKEARSALAHLTMDSGQRELLIGVLLELIREM
jgi:hypothetical protein